MIMNKLHCTRGLLLFQIKQLCYYRGLVTLAMSCYSDFYKEKYIYIIAGIHRPIIASLSDSVRNLGVIFDSDFSFHKHIYNICKSCFYHIGLRDLHRIRRHLPLSTAKTISNSLITSRLDYCNSLINNIAKQDLSKLQRVQNCLARVVLRAPRFSPSLPLFKQLHWLPVNYRIKFKLSTLTYRALAIHQPPYLASLLHFYNVPRQLQIIYLTAA